MKLPNGELAVIPEGKLRDYCLSQTHPRGRNKARVFRRVLGVTAGDPTSLEELVRKSAVEGETTPLRQDEFGTYYRVELEIDGLQKRERLRTLWIIRRGEVIPRLVSTYIE